MISKKTIISVLAVAVSWCMVACSSVGPASIPAPGPKDDQLAQDLRGGDNDARLAAIARAHEVGPSAIVRVAPLLDDPDPSIVRAAECALADIAHGSSRPNAEAERAQCSMSLVKEAQNTAHKTDARLTLLRLLASTANDPWSIAEIGNLLKEEDVAKMAVWALEGIAHEAAEEVLVAGLARREQPAFDAVVHALAHRPTEKATDALLILAKDPDGDLARQARHALSMSHDIRVVEALAEAALEGLPGARDDFFNAVDNQIRAGRHDLATKHLARFVDDPLPEIRSAALHSLAAMPSRESANLVFARLDDAAASVRASSVSVLRQWDPQLVDPLILTAYDGASPVVKDSMLCVLADRTDDASHSLVVHSLDDGDKSVRIRALRILAQGEDTSIVDVVWSRVEAGDDDEREVALATYLAHADRMARKGHPDEALAMIHRSLKRAASEGARRSALSGMTTIASPESLSVLNEVDLEEVREDVARARYAIANAVCDKDPDLAKSIYEMVYASSRSKNRRSLAVRKLEGLGIDTRSFPRKAGFLLDWQVIGPFTKATDEDFESHPFQEGVALESSFEGLDGQVSWRAVSSDDIDGLIDLDRLFEQNTDCVGYGYAEFARDEAGNARLQLGSDDGIAVWLNGTMVLSHDIARGVTIDEDIVPIALQAGTNTLLVKIAQGGGDWGFCVRLADSEGNPIDLNPSQ